MQNAHREEVINTVLAELLNERGITSSPEQRLRLPGGGSRRAMPDVIVRYGGLRIAIEGKVDDGPATWNDVLQQARERLEQGIAHLTLAVLYPVALRHVSFDDLKTQLAATPLRIQVCSEAQDTPGGTITVDGITNIIRQAYSHLVQEDIVSEAVSELKDGIENLRSLLEDYPAISERIADVLGVGEPPHQSNGVGDE